MTIDKHIEKVIQAADVVVWAHACNSQKKKGLKNPCDLKGAIEDLTEAMEKLELSRYTVIMSNY